MTGEEVLNKHPDILKSTGRVGVGDGWLPVIDKYCTQLDTLAKETGIQVIAQQVKEKFGGLRFYYLMETPDKCDENWVTAADRFVKQMEEECDRTCENCGKPGSTKGSVGWITCLCEECRNKKRG